MNSSKLLQLQELNQQAAIILARATAHKECMNHMLSYTDPRRGVYEMFIREMLTISRDISITVKKILEED